MDIGYSRTPSVTTLPKRGLTSGPEATQPQPARVTTPALPVNTHFLPVTVLQRLPAATAQAASAYRAARGAVNAA